MICKLKSKFWNNASSENAVIVSFCWKNTVYRNEIIIVTRYVCLSLFFCKFPINFSCPTRFLDFLVLFVSPYWSMVSLTLNMRYVPSNLAVCIMYSPQRNGSNVTTIPIKEKNELWNRIPPITGWQITFASISYGINTGIYHGSWVKDPSALARSRKWWAFLIQNSIGKSVTRKSRLVKMFVHFLISLTNMSYIVLHHDTFLITCNLFVGKKPFRTRAVGSEEKWSSVAH